MKIIKELGAKISINESDILNSSDIIIQLSDYLMIKVRY